MSYRKSKRQSNRLMVVLISIFAAVIVFFIAAVIIVNNRNSDWKESSSSADSSSGGNAAFVAKPNSKDETDDKDHEKSRNYPNYANDVQILTDANIYSDFAVLLDVQSNEILASRGAELKMSPASMTKLMTLLVCIENITDYNATYTITYEMISPLIEQEAARAGFEDQETVSITDLLYGMILPSGADATIALVRYVADTEENFVNLMNDKAAELGMNDTHFCNATGLYDTDHYSTAVDMAMLMKEVMKNDICRKILGTVTYTTTSTQQHPGGIVLKSTAFSRMYGNEVSGIEIIGAKTGFHDQARQCLASYARAIDGREYVLITAHAPTDMDTIWDAFAIYGTITGTYAMPDDLDTRSTTTASDVYVIVTDKNGVLVTDENGNIVTALASSSDTTETETVNEADE